MDQLFTFHLPFQGFGTTTVYPANFASVTCFKAKSKTVKLKSWVEEEIPDQPGIYGMLDANQELIYIGKAKKLRTRLLSYFRGKSREAKAGRIIRETKVLLYETTPNEFSALVRELELIQKFKPKFNVIGIPDHRRLSYIALTRTPAGIVQLRRPTGQESALYGPFAGNRIIREAVRQLNLVFFLRDCPQNQKMEFADDLRIFSLPLTPGCLRYELKTCLAPCIAACKRDEYRDQVNKAKAFLEGKDPQCLHQLLGKMKSAAKNYSYELAAILRDQYDQLSRLSERLGWLRQTRMKQSFIYPLPSIDSRVIWTFIQNGLVLESHYLPQTVQEKETLIARIQVIFQQKKIGQRLKPSVDSVLLVAAWFRKYSAQRDNLLTPAQAIQLLQDRC